MTGPNETMQESLRWAVRYTILLTAIFVSLWVAAMYSWSDEIQQLGKVYIEQPTDINTFRIDGELKDDELLIQSGGWISDATSTWEISDATPMILISKQKYDTFIQRDIILRQELQRIQQRRAETLVEKSNLAAENGRLRDLLARVFTAKSLDELIEEFSILLKGDKR